jgi:hypothetical protein
MTGLDRHLEVLKRVEGEGGEGDFLVRIPVAPGKNYLRDTFGRKSYTNIYFNVFKSSLLHRF